MTRLALIRRCLGLVVLMVGCLSASAVAQTLTWAEIAGRDVDVSQSQLAAADAARMTGDFAGAIRETDVVLASSPNDVDAHAIRIAAMFGAGDDALLDAHVSALESSAPDVWADPRVSYFHALTLARTGRIGPAGDRLEEAIRYQPDLLHAAYYLTAVGELRLAAGDVATAALFFRQAITADADFVHARLGLAVVHALSGRVHDARAEAAPVVFASADQDPLALPASTFFVPEGQRHLYDAVVADVRGDFVGATAALDAWGASPAGASFDRDSIERIREAMGRPMATVDTWSTGCASVGRFTVEAANALVAIRCDGQDIRVARGVLEHPARFEPVSGFASGRNDASLAWTVIDLAWSGDGPRLHVLLTSGASETLDLSRGGGQSESLIPYAGDGVVPIAFGENPDDVLWSGLWGAGVFVADRTTAPVVGVPSYLPSGQSVGNGAVTRDGRIIVSSAYAIEVLRGPAPWTQVATHSWQPDDGPWGTSHDGHSLWTVSSGHLIERDLERFAPLRSVPLPDVNDRGLAITGPVTAIESVSSDEVWVAQGGTLVRVRFATVDAQP